MRKRPRRISRSPGINPQPLQKGHTLRKNEKKKANQTQEQIDEVEQQIDTVLQEVVDLNNSILEYQTQIEKLNIYLSSGLTPPFALVRNLGVQLIFLILIIYFLSRSVLLIKRNVRH